MSARRSQRVKQPLARAKPESGGAPRTRRAAKSRRVALLGGSFNPPHVAHVMAAWWVLVTEDVDEVWLLPTYRHAFGKELAPFVERVRMCRLAVKGLSRVKVSTVEKDLARDPHVGRTVRVLEHLRAHHPRTRFALVVGTDILRDVAKWYRWADIQKLADVIVVGREGYPTGARPGAPLLPRISSTEVRERLAHGDDVRGLVGKAVEEYAEKKGLYRR